MRGRVALQAGIYFAERAEFFHIEIAGARKHAVPHGRDVPVGKEENIFANAVHAEVWIVAEDAEVHGHEKFGAAEGAARVAALHGTCHADDVAPDLRADFF